MKEVSGPIIAIALVLCAVFVPIAFVSGLSGQFYRQSRTDDRHFDRDLGVLVADPVMALAATLLKPHDAPKDALTRGMDKVFGGFFRWFNCFFGRASTRYEGGVNGVLKRKSAAVAVYVLLAIAAVFMFKAVPSGFVLRPRTSSTWSALPSCPTPPRSTARKR
ncbi:efflux RND transporter permease subunit [Massilia sp. B-10]|nr:efflux RND transporter permease subunit [Massilia sp. B-10]